jgi:hypothetical protein
MICGAGAGLPPFGIKVTVKAGTEPPGLFAVSQDANSRNRKEKTRTKRKGTLSALLLYSTPPPK